MTDRQTTVPAGSHGGPFHTGQPRFVCIHSLEAPARAGMAWSLARGWMQGAGTSVHALTDPGESVDLVGLGIIAYHCGGGNDYAIGDEHTGYAAWTFDEWTGEPAFSALRNGARKAAKQALQLGIPRRWLSLAQIRDGQSTGFVTHNDMRLVFGGTTHTDPGPGFPYALFIKMCQQFAGDLVKATPTPNPLPPAGPGGAQSEEDLMRSIFFTYLGDVIDADGNPAVVSRVFETDGAVFQHIGSMETLELRLAFLTAIGVKAQLVTDGRIGLVDATSALQVATAGPVVDPFVFGYDATAGR